jgi:hypothetical protein
VSRRALLLLAALAAASAVLVARRGGAPPATAAVSERRAAARAASPARPEPDVDPDTIRDVFRFVERAPAQAFRPLERPDPQALATATPPPEPYRLVGLVRRHGKLLAAFSVAGDVVLAGPGETVGGATVVEVGEEAVRIRRPDGSETRLPLP